MTERKPRDSTWLNANLRRGAFHRWIGVEVLAVDHAAGSIEMRVPWRDEFTGAPNPPSAHGGMLSAFVDVTAFFLVGGVTGQLARTVDLRTDFHSPATPGDLILTGRVIRAGGRLVTADVQILGADRGLTATGRVVMTMFRLATEQP